jgi:hypothetical protein
MALLVPFQGHFLLMASSISVFGAWRWQSDEPTLVHAQEHDTSAHRFKFAVGSTPINGLTHAPRDFRAVRLTVCGDDLPDFL